MVHIIWEFPNLVVLNLVSSNFYVEALSLSLFCALLRSFAPFCALLRSFVDLRLLSFALICADPPTLAFWKKAWRTPKKTRVLLLEEPLKSFEEKGKTHKKAREIGRT